MSITSQITRINNNISNAYSACNAKGATMPAAQNSANLADCISSISSGGGSIETFLKGSLIDLSCSVTDDGTGMGGTLNISLNDYNDALQSITGKSFSNTSYDSSTNTWTSNDGTLTLKVDTTDLDPKYQTIEDEGGSNIYFNYPVVTAYYGYFEDRSDGLGTQTLGIVLSNISWNASAHGTMLMLGVTEIMLEDNTSPEY